MTNRKKWAFAELCAGTGAVAMHLTGVRAVVTMHGSKWRFAKDIAKVIADRGFIGAPTRIDLVDPGVWGITHGALARNPWRVHSLVSRLNVAHPRAIYDSLNHAKVPDCAFDFAAEHLFLQRVSFGGKSVSVKDGRWKAVGYNKSSAEGLAKSLPTPATETKPATKGFGEIKPQVPSLIRRILALAQSRQPYTIAYHLRSDEYLREVDRIHEVYLIDPPYQGTTGYGDKFSRDDVIATANRLRASGALVIVCEAEPIAELVANGWEVSDITRGGGKGMIRANHKGEYLTVSP